MLNPFDDIDLLVARVDQLARNDDLQEKLRETELVFLDVDKPALARLHPTREHQALGQERIMTPVKTPKNSSKSPCRSTRSTKQRHGSTPFAPW